MLEGQGRFGHFLGFLLTPSVCVFHFYFIFPSPRIPLYPVPLHPALRSHRAAPCGFIEPTTGQQEGEEGVSLVPAESRHQCCPPGRKSPQGGFAATRPGPGSQRAPSKRVDSRNTWR